MRAEAAGAEVRDAASSFEAFADAYRAVKDLDVGALLDAESGAALLFADVCSERARLGETGAPSSVVALDDDDAYEWDTEQHTWTIVQLLFAERLGGVRSTSVAPPPHPYETPLVAVQRVLDASPELAELKVRAARARGRR